TQADDLGQTGDANAAAILAANIRSAAGAFEADEAGRLESAAQVTRTLIRGLAGDAELLASSANAAESMDPSQATLVLETTLADARTRRELEGAARASGLTDRLSGRIAVDLKISLRGLVRTPGFTAVSVLTLAIGLGSSAAIYTLLDRVVFDPLPYPNADRLLRLENRVPGVSPDAVWRLS
ncbi:MAG: hypothetical protein GY895_12545, partial [Phycisphaera sp.]|nr:hypothetical protein [Phycisphaera sp.]